MENVIREWAPFGIALCVVWRWWQWLELCDRAERIEKRVDALFDDMLIDEEEPDGETND